MAMTYEDEVAVGGCVTSAIQQTLSQNWVTDEDRERNFANGSSPLIGSLAQAVLLKIDQAGYQIVKK
jgi:hypothetical protein